MIQDYLKGQTQLINMYLEQYLPKGEPKVLFDAIEYSLKAGGKRIRPILVLESAKTLKEDIDIKNFIDIAISTEFIHTYSLIHDDLPAMDDDDLRRGKPTCHKQFSEAIAILAGDGLLTYAFELISLNKNLPAEKLLKIINILSHNVGIYGMVGGQAGDILEDFKDIDFIHLNKTAKFIQACCQIGAVIADATPAEENKLKNYGKHIGIAFQIWDDLLDEIGDPSKLGKKVNKDKEKNKITYPSIYGIEKSKEMAYNHINQAVSYIKDLKNPQILIQIAEFIVSREV